MSFADANRASIRVIEESVWGTTPTSGATREVRLTSSSLSATKETVTSEELRADRMVSAITEVSAASEGDINFEFSAGAQDEFLAAFVMGAWSRPMTRDFWKGRTISVTGSSAITVAGRDLTGYLAAGRRILLKGFTTPANNGYFQIASVALSGSDTVITVNETTLVAEAGTAAARLFDANDVIVLNNTNIASTSTGFSAATGTPFAAAIAAGQLKVGQKIKVDGLTGVTGIYTILSLTDSAILTAPVPTAVVAAGDPVTIKGSMLRNPGEVADIAQRKFTIETAFNDIGQYMVQDGMVPGTFSLEIAAGAIVTGTIGFQGRATRLLTSTVLSGAGYTVLGSTTGEVVNATTNVGSIEKDGVVADAAIQSISISGEANLRQQSAVGSKFARGIGAGRFNLTGALTIYFEDGAMFNDFINHATVSLSFPVTDLDGQTYVFTLPSIKFSADQIAPGGIDQDVFDNIEWTAFRDPATECMLQVDRFSPNIAD